MQTDKPIKGPDLYLINAEETERHLLSWIINSEKAFNEIAPHLKLELFDTPKCKIIAGIIIDLIKEESEVTWQTIVARVNALPYPSVTMADIADLISIPGSSTAPIKTLLKTLDMYRKCRAMVQLSQLLWVAGTKEPQYDKQEDEIEKFMEMFDEIRLGIEEPIITLEESIEENKRIIKDNQDPATRHTGMMTGFHLIDNWGGLPIGMTILGAKSSHGKSAMAMAWALNAAKTGQKVAIFSFEMPSEELSARAMAMETHDAQVQVSANAIMRMPLKPDEIAATEHAIQKLTDAGCMQNILLNADLSSSYTKMEMKIKQVVSHSGVKVVFVDYLQLVEMARKNGMTKEDLIGQISHRLHNIAVKMKIHIVVLSQMNRGVEGEPNMFHLRDSGQIGEAADSVAILWRPEQDHVGSYNSPHQNWPTNGTAILKMEKFRNGPTGDCLVRYTPQLTRYDDIPEGEVMDAGQTAQKELFSADVFK